MDNLTHTLFGLTLANAGLRRVTPGATAALLIASNAPDVDFLSGVFGGRVSYLAHHRGVTHGLVGMVAIAALTALLVRTRRPGANLARLFGIALLAATGHIALDWPTSYGTRILSPFLDRWYTLDLMPIIDPFLWVLLALGLGLAWWRSRLREPIAIVTLALMAAFYGVRGWAHERAVELMAANDAEAREARDLAVLPTFFSPFDWRGIADFGDRYVVDAVDVRAGTLRRVALLRDSGDMTTPALARARSTRTAQVFLRFARFPLVNIEARSGNWMVTWRDVRFLRPTLGIGRADERRTPFVAIVWISRDGRVLDERLGL